MEEPKIKRQVPNNVVSLADHYKHFYNAVLDAMTPHNREGLYKLMTAKLRVIRGQEIPYPEVRVFCRMVAEFAEGAYDATEAKKLKQPTK